MRQPKKTAALGFIAFALGSAGCHLIYPFDLASSDSDLGAAADSGGADLDRDVLQRPERPPVDASVDHPLTDSAADGAKEQGPISPCATKLAVHLYPSKTMAVCVASMQYKIQCDADALCSEEWHLCPASEYLARGGVGAPPVIDAWIAACIRESNGTPNAPSESSCKACSAIPGTQVTGSWPCAAGQTSMLIHDTVGVVTFSACQHLGTSTAPGGYWRSMPVDVTRPAAVCCK